MSTNATFRNVTWILTSAHSPVTLYAPTFISKSVFQSKGEPWLKAEWRKDSVTKQQTGTSVPVNFTLNSVPNLCCTLRNFSASFCLSYLACKMVAFTVTLQSDSAWFLSKYCIYNQALYWLFTMIPSRDYILPLTSGHANM